MNPGILFMLKIEKELEDQRQSRLPLRENRKTQSQPNHSGKATLSKGPSVKCPGAVACAIEQTQSLS